MFYVSLRPSDVYMREIMVIIDSEARRKMSEAMLAYLQLDHWEYISTKIESKYIRTSITFGACFYSCNS